MQSLRDSSPVKQRWLLSTNKLVTQSSNSPRPNHALVCTLALPVFKASESHITQLRECI